MAKRITVGHHRFTCLSPTLVRMEFAPDGRFEDRRSLVAYPEQKPIPFRKRSRDGAWTVFDTGRMTIRARDHKQAFSETNLEVRWSDGKLLQFWRPGDNDPRNLGGTVRSLDRYGPDARMEGVHDADMAPPDAKGLTWLAWLQCETDPAYYAKSPHPPQDANRGNWHRAAQKRDHGGRLLERTLNATIDSHKFSTGVLSRSGYYFLNDSSTPVLDNDDFPVARDRPGAQDWYFFAYAQDYKQALADFVRLTGPAPLPPRQAFGLIFSRWPAYDEAEAKRIIQTFAGKGYPLSVLVLDMEWHKEGWGHWEWNPDFYEDPAAFFQWCHDRGIAVTLNDHPLYVRDDDRHFAPYVKATKAQKRIYKTTYNKKTIRAADVDICDKRQATAFLKSCHKPILEQGLDFWWNDGCKGTLPGAINQLVCNKLCFDEVKRPDHRGMLLARYGGMGSHRYGAFFTGDTSVCWEVLQLQCEFNIRAGHLGLAYVSHDMGGFCCGKQMIRENPDGAAIIDPVLYTRWLQFGVFNPVLRFHSAPGAGSRQPWDYEGLDKGACKRWLRVRNSLLPYVYAAAREHYETGVPPVRGLFLDEPANQDAYPFDQFLFGPDLLVAPVLTAENQRRITLPAGDWWTFEGRRRLDGGRTFTRRVGLSQIPVYVRAGSILLRQDPDANLHAAHVDPLVLDVYPGADGEAVLYEDDGTSCRFEKKGFCKTRFTLEDRGKELVLRSRKPAGRPFAKDRHMQVLLPLARRPRRIRLDRRRLDPKTCVTKQGQRMRIDLGRIDATKAFALRVRP